jgi:hypothetical protein
VGSYNERSRARRAPSHRSRAGSPLAGKTWVGVSIVVGLALVANLVWIAHDHQAPPWDQALYLHITAQWRHALSLDGVSGFVSSMYHTDPSYAPLYMLMITPFEAISHGVDASLVANTLMFCGTIAVAAAIAVRLYGERAALPAAIFAGTCPLVYGLSRTTLVDTLVIFLVALAVLAAVISDGFQRRKWALFCGLCVGLATLTKVTAPGVVILPTLCCLALPEQLQARRQVQNVVLASGVAVLVCLPWYAVNFGPTLDYLHSATSGQLAIGTTGSPLTVHAFLAYSSLTIDSGFGVILVLTLLCAAALLIIHGAVRRLHRRDVARVAVPASWFLVGFVVLAVSHNQDIRYLAPGVVGFAILAAGAIAAIRPRALGVGLLTVAAGALGFQFLSYVVTFPPEHSVEVQVGPASFRGFVPFDGVRLDYARRPGVPDYATPVVRALAAARARLGSARLDVCLLETHEVINGNTLGFVAENLRVPLTWTDLSYQPSLSAATLKAELAACPAALYIPGDSGTGRVGVLNHASAAFRVTPAELSGFDGARTTLPVGDGLSVVVLERAR